MIDRQENVILLADIAATWEAVSATRARNAKTALIAEALTALAPDELAAGTAMLTGAPRQGRLGVGWRTVTAIDAAPANDPSLTVAEVDTAFEELAGTSGSGSRARRDSLLSGLWARATTREQRLLSGLVLHELRQGALDGVVMAAVARASDVDEAIVRRAAMLSGDLTAAAVIAMTQDQSMLAAVGLQVGRPVQPMLASSEPDVATALTRTGPARVETKLDGMRIQVHREGDDVHVFTRTLRDVTADMPNVVEVVADLPVSAIVLDGEALAVTPDGRPRPFQDTMSSGGRLQPFFFDLLHLDGVDVLDLPLSDRFSLLAQVPGLPLVDGIMTDDASDGTAHLRAALDGGHEGVVVKALASPWEAGRRGSSWVKVKVAHTLDLVVLAVEWGSGRRKGWLSNLHLGARDDTHHGPAPEFVMLGKTFKGLTDELLAWQTKRLLELQTDRDGQIVYVRPELVVEIAFDGVQASTRYPGGVTLRFARVKRYREDKEPGDADTITTIRGIHQGTITANVE